MLRRRESSFARQMCLWTVTTLLAVSSSCSLKADVLRGSPESGSASLALSSLEGGGRHRAESEEEPAEYWG